jgi:hypothetical protein
LFNRQSAKNAKALRVFARPRVASPPSNLWFEDGEAVREPREDPKRLGVFGALAVKTKP